MKKFIVFIVCLLTFTCAYAEEVNIVNDDIINQNELSTNNKVEEITIDKEKIEGFDPDINNYSNIIVKKPVVFVDVKGSDPKATITGVGMVFCKENVETKININVTSEDGKTNTYTLSVTYVKEVIKSVDASIDMIELYNKDTKLDFNFDKDKSSFKIQIDSDIDKVLVKASLSNDKASFIEGYEPGEYTLNYKDNIIELRTMSENMDTRIYTINIIRTDNRKSDNTLKELIINGNKINIEENKYDYETKVSFDNLKTNITAKTNDKNAKVIYKNINLYEGNNNIVIKVVAENEKVREYRINVIREEKEIIETNNELLDESLEIENADVVVPITKEKEENNVTNTNTNDSSIMDNNTHINKESNNLVKYIILGIGIILLSASIILLKKSKR